MVPGSVSLTKNTFMFGHQFYLLSVGPAKVNKVKIFSGPCYMSKCVLAFVSDVQESVLVDFISQNKVKICQNCLYQKFSYKNEQTYIFYNFFEFLSCY